MLLKDPKIEAYINQKLEKQIDKDVYSSAMETAESFGAPISQILLDQSFITEKELGNWIAAFLKTDYISLKDKKIPTEILNLITEESARHHSAVIFDKKEQTLLVGMTDPRDYEAIEYIEKKTGYQVEPYLILEDDFLIALHAYKTDLHSEFKTIVNVPEDKKGVFSKDLEKAAQEISVIKALNTLLEYGVAENASDVHIEGEEKEVLIRFRIDGVLHDVLTLSKEMQQALVARIKILSNLKIDEHRVPQDGRFKFNFGGTEIALRVSIIPTFFEENVVMRILHESERPKTLDELGFVGNNRLAIERNLKKSHGMILVTGPTGSGKTTTLYSLLSMLNSPGTKVCTVEDPIEYGIRRISQIQVNAKTGLTFASGLRALLRHDPDIIMVGEIRDKETATIAIHSALTGHLVLSTLHTNSALATLPRLLDLDIEKFLVGSTINVILAQRLVRTICEYCKTKQTVPEELLTELSTVVPQSLADLKKNTYYHGKGCNRCHSSGYKGRAGIHEVLEVDDSIRDLIAANKPVSQIESQARKNGMSSLLEDGIEKAKEGITTIEEILRVTRE